MERSCPPPCLPAMLTAGDGLVAKILPALLRLSAGFYRDSRKWR